MKFSQYIILCLTSYLEQVALDNSRLTTYTLHNFNFYLIRFKYLSPGEWRILDLLYFWHVFCTRCFLILISIWIDCISLLLRNEYWPLLGRFISYNLLETFNTAARKMITEKSATIDTYLTNILKLHFIVYCWHLDTIVLTHMPLIYWSIMIIGVFSNFDWGKIQPSWLMSSTPNWVTELRLSLPHLPVDIGN